jgi:hypothetical protein
MSWKKYARGIMSTIIGYNAQINNSNNEMKNRKYHNVGTIPKSNRK